MVTSKRDLSGSEHSPWNQRAGSPQRSSTRRPRETTDIVEYLREFELTLYELEPRQTAMFVAARNSADLVRGLEIPAANWSRPDDDEGLRERKTEGFHERTTCYSNFVRSRVPENEMSVEHIRGVEELPQIFPTQWLLEETCAPVFYAKLADHELIMPRWERPDSNLRNGQHDTQKRELVRGHVAAQFTRQYAYVLLDVSRSMNNRDCRGTLARGLTLAFLLQGRAQRAELQLRPFAADVAELSHGSSSFDFRAIVRRVVELENAGQTRIQPALERATSDIRQPGPCYRADILLITDGLSRLSRNPLVGEHLHTFILGKLKETDDSAQSFRKLESWSQTYHHLRPHQFAQVLSPLKCDLDAAVAELERAKQSLENGTCTRSAHEVRRLADNVQSLLQEGRKYGNVSSAPREARDAIEQDLRRVRQMTSHLANGPSSSGEGSQRPHSRQSGATWSMVFGHSDNDTSGRLGLWQLLRQCGSHLIRWIRSVFRLPRFRK